VGGVFIAVGVAHFVVPAFFEAIVPPWLPAWLPSPRALVLWSGAAEIAGGLGALVPRTRRAAGWGLLLLLVAVFPANVHMLLDALARDAAWWWSAALIARLPMQPLLMWWVWRALLRPHRATPT
jgi:uncharacterized membrane protein